MKIGVHAHAAFKRKKMGVERYTYELLKEWFRLPEAHQHQWMLYTPVAPDRHEHPYLQLSARVVPWKLPFGWTQWRLPRKLRRDRLDVFFSPAHVLPSGIKRGVVVVHGLEYEIIPECYGSFQRMYLRNVTKKAVQRASHIIAASEATRRDIINHYNVDEKKISVIYHGATFPSAASPIFPKDTRPFLLNIGRLEHKKNIVALIEAFEILADRGHPHQLVLVGGSGHGAKEIHQRIRRSPVRDRITTTGFVREETKWAILKQADVFLFPSRYEGFGLPILEAQYAGIPIVATNNSSLPEIVGKGGLLVDLSPLAIVEATERLLSDTALRKNFIRRGKENVARFSWSRCARQTLDVLERVARDD